MNFYHVWQLFSVLKGGQAHVYMSWWESGAAQFDNANPWHHRPFRLHSNVLLSTIRRTDADAEKGLPKIILPLTGKKDDCSSVELSVHFIHAPDRRAKPAVSDRWSRGKHCELEIRGPCVVWMNQGPYTIPGSILTSITQGCDAKLLGLLCIFRTHLERHGIAPPPIGNDNCPAQPGRSRHAQSLNEGRAAVRITTSQSWTVSGSILPPFPPCLSLPGAPSCMYISHRCG